MDPQNPYAPPVETADAPPPMVPDTGGLTLSEQGWETVTSLAKWMRIVSTFFFIGGALMALGTLFALVGGGAALSRSGGLGATGGAAVGVGLFVMLATTVLLFLGGAWLRQSAFHFYDGVLSNAEHALAQGFRKLRLYMILYGVWGILQLIKTVVELFTARGF
jgi:hypothetical protein